LKILKNPLTYLIIIGIFIGGFIGDCIYNEIDRETNHPCEYYYPYKIVNGFIYEDKDFFSSSTKYFITLKGKRRGLDEACECNLRVTEQKYYELIEKWRH